MEGVMGFIPEAVAIVTLASFICLTTSLIDAVAGIQDRNMQLHGISAYAAGFVYIIIVTIGLMILRFCFGYPFPF